MKEMKRILSLVLCLAMLVSMIPGTVLTAFAAEGTQPTAVVVAGSDFQNSGGDSAGGATVTSIMNQMGYSSVDGVLFGGDYSSGYSTNTNLTNLDGYLDDYCATADNRIYIQGNHDTYLTPGSGLLDKEGSHDPESGASGVYAINHEDFPWSGSSESLVSGTANLLKTYLDAKAADNYKKPIFVMSHLPLHYTKRGDNDYANLLFDVLNGYDDLNIIFLFGHNHSGGYDAYLGNGSIYLPKGSNITVAGGSTSTLNFTYMNYGYVGYVTGSACTHLTMTAFDIYEDEVIIKRYDADSQHLLKEKGATVSGYNTDANEYGYAVLDLSDGTSATYDLPADSGDNNTGSDGSSNSGTTGGSGNVYTLDTDGVATGEDYLIVSAGADGTAYALRNNGGSVASAEVTISNGQIVTDAEDIIWTYDDSKYLSNDGQYIYLTSGSSISFDANEPRAMAITSNNAGEGAYTAKREGNYNYYLNYSNANWTCGSSADDIYFFVRTTETGSGGGSTVTPEGGDWVTISSGVGGTIYTLDEDGLNVGSDEKYLIVDTSANGTGNVLTNSNGTAANTQLTITDKVIVVEDDTNVAWTPTGSSSSANFANGSYNIYLSYNNGVLHTSSRSLAVTHKGDGEYTLKRDSSRSGYYVQYDSSKGWETLSTTSNSVYLFRKTGTASAGDAEYAKLDGELTYTVARGASSEEALAAVMAGINVLTSANADGSEPTTLEDSNTDITWTLASYDGTVAGEYAVTISYKGVKLGTAKVIVPEVTITGYDCQKLGSVKVGASGKTRTGANLTVNLEDGTSYTVPVTLDMLSGNFTTDEAGEYTGLTVTYNGVKICEDFVLNVREPSSYPEYPDEGAVQVNKTGTGIQFQSTGVAQVEISASGIPMNQGVDVLLVLDASSSMEGTHAKTFEITDESGNTKTVDRMDLLRDAVNNLIVQFQTKREDGSNPEIDIAIITFNGNTVKSGTNVIGSAGSRSSTYGIKTGDGTIAGAWEDINEISSTWATDGSNAKTPASSGTNYDYGLQMAYDVLAQKQADNATERQQFVLFLSDGAPSQYNGVESNDGEKDYLKWLRANYDETDEDTSNDIPSTVTTNKSFYAGFNNDQGQPHHTAEAIKADPSEAKKVVRFVGTDSTGTLEDANGLGATIYSIGLLLEAGSARSVDDQETVLKTIASTDPETGEKRFTSITSVDGLGETFTEFGSDVLMAAYEARFVDQMGDAYNLQMGQILDVGKNPIDVENKIEILSYDIWTRSDYLAEKCTADQIGDRKGTYTVLETITFNADGTEVYSDKIYTTDDAGNKTYPNILAPKEETETDGFADGVIYAKNFYYNTNKDKAVKVEGVSIPTGVDSTTNLTTGSTNMLPAETFYWNIGTIKTSELAMRYFVYLTGSMEGTREAGSYPTNNYATLYYDNYLENPCYKDTVSPVLAWKAANVSYAFYLVNENGEIIVNQTTGETGSFANKIAVTNPVVYEEILLNNVVNVESLAVASSEEGVLPPGYELYDTGAVYTIAIKSDATGSWNIAKGTDKATTYVTQFNPNNAAAYSNELTRNSDADFTHTVVWFAVKWKVQALPDTVVIDYGLPVDISVLTNDMFGANGKLVAVGSADGVSLDGHETALHANFLTQDQQAKTSHQVTYGTATANTTTGKVRYVLGSMEMNGYDKFAYAVNYTGATNPGYYYDTVTVIPATTIYFEDNFVDYSSFTWNNGWVEVNDENEKWTWKQEAKDPTGTQSEDRPGEYSLTDANNIYGYDGVNLSMSTFSMGSAAMATVDYDNYAQAQFAFWGTGFDIISMTSNMTGTILVDVEKEVNNAWAEFDNFSVDTYYGYKQVSGDANKDGVVEEGEMIWVVDPEADDSLYQVPVIKMADQDYGHYRVTIKATYDEAFDHVAPSNKNGSYDFYLDAIRIYDPANDGASDGSTDQTIENAYTADHEGWPSYIELRNKLIAAGKLGNSDTDTEIEGLVFIDGDSKVGDAQIVDYKNFGPNNEVYLKPGQRVAFLLNTSANVDRVHIGLKSADGVSATCTITNVALNDIPNSEVEAGGYFNIKNYALDTATDMYYDLTGWKGHIVVISNTGDRYGTAGIVSITNIKTTYKSDPNSTQPQGEDTAETSIYMTPKAAEAVLMALKPQPVNPFADVQKDQFFYESVMWAVSKGITDGVDAAHFGPYLTCNRAQVVTFLWRAAGSPAPVSRNNPFKDVPENSWYTDAVLWAVENGITTGLTADTFGPDALCNRAQVVTFLWRANGSKVAASENPFVDVPADAFYYDAVVWALQSGITTGATATEFSPNGTCMRAQVVTFLYRAAHLQQLQGADRNGES